MKRWIWIIAFVALVALVTCFQLWVESLPPNPSPELSLEDDTPKIMIVATGSWSGSVTSNKGGSYTVNGYGNRTIPDCNCGTFQMDGQGTLRAAVLYGYETGQQAETSTPYGIVTVCGR